MNRIGKAFQVVPEKMSVEHAAHFALPLEYVNFAAQGSRIRAERSMDVRLNTFFDSSRPVG